MVIQVLKKVFRKPSYFALAFLTGGAVFLFAVWFPNIRLIAVFMGHTGTPFLERLDLPISLVGSIATNFTALSASYTIAISVLFGMNLAMLVYLLRRRIDDLKQSGIATGFLGVTSGVLGMGCAACGSFLLSGILPLIGASGMRAVLPLGGGEFGILGVILLSASLYLTAQQIQNPAVCKIKL
jgi:hypothetical protein